MIMVSYVFVSAHYQKILENGTSIVELIDVRFIEAVFVRNRFIRHVKFHHYLCERQN